MLTDKPFRQTAALPLNYRATFQWSQAAGLKVLWEPDVPCIRSPRAQSKFRDAYNAARRSFMTDIATVVGGSALILDIDGKTEIVRPASKH